MSNGNLVEPFPEEKAGKMIREEEDKDFRGGHIAFEVAFVRPSVVIKSLLLLAHLCWKYGHAALEACLGQEHTLA